MSGVHGGVKFYRGSAAAARSYVEADRSRVDDYYLAEGTGLATRYVAERATSGAAVAVAGRLDGPTYERWVAGYDVETDQEKGRLRTDERGLRFVEVVVNGPKTWSLAASLHPQIAVAYDAAQERAAVEIIGWLAEHSTTRVGPRGRQVQVPVERLEAAVVRHYTSRAGDPHRHLHLQINARVFAQGRWRGLHSVGVVGSIEAINGIGHAAVACDPEFREALAVHGYTLDPDTSEVAEFAPYVGAFSARASQIGRNVDRYEASWRADHPSEEPGPRLRRGWDRRAWAEARPDKIVPTDGAQLAERWREALRELGFTPPRPGIAVELPGTPIGRLNRDRVVELVLSRLGARRSSWNGADIRGEVERIVGCVDIIAPGPVRRELVEDLTTRTIDACEPLLGRGDVPEHVRALTSRGVLDVEAELNDRLCLRAEHGARDLVVVEGAAGAGKTTRMRSARRAVEAAGHWMVVVTPTLKAAQVASEEIGTSAFSAAWLVHQHGWRWDADGRWTRVPTDRIDPAAVLEPGDELVIDEAGMLDQDTARALLTIADENRARVVLVGDRHQLPAVGRGGVLDLALRWALPEAVRPLTTVHRFTDPDYAELSLLMRTGERPGEVFDALVDRGQIVVHASEVERLAALTTAQGLVVADTREQVAALNSAIRDHRLTTGQTAQDRSLTTATGERVGVGDRVATRRNDRVLGVANRDTWTVTDVRDDGRMRVSGRNGDRTLPASYAREHVELAYASTVHGAQGETVDLTHVVIGESTGAAAAYVGMTRGRHSNTAQLVAETLEDARAQWVEVFNRDGADLGPAHAADRATEDIERYGPCAPADSGALAMQRAALGRPDPEPQRERYTTPEPPSAGIGI